MSLNTSSYLILKERNGYIFRFPAQARQIISGHIFEIFCKEHSSNSDIVNNIIESIKNKDLDQEWIGKLPINSLTKLNDKINQVDLLPAFNNYFRELVQIISKIKTYSEDHQSQNDILSLTKLARELKGEGINLGLGDYPSHSFVSNVLKYIKKDLNYNIDHTTKHSLYDNGVLRECCTCHKRKLYEEFNVDRRGKRTICKFCQRKNDSNRLIEKFINKKKIMLEMGNGMRCENKGCNTKEFLLPVYVSHHQDPLKKTFSLGEIIYECS